MEKSLNRILTDGLLGKPTLWPHVVNKLTRHSRTRDCDSHGLFQPLNGAVSAGDKLALRRGEFGVPVILCDKWTAWLLLLLPRFKFCIEPVSDFNKMRRPINGVCDTSNVNSIVRPANSYFRMKSTKFVGQSHRNRWWISKLPFCKRLQSHWNCHSNDVMCHPVILVAPLAMLNCASQPISVFSMLLSSMNSICRIEICNKKNNPN